MDEIERMKEIRLRKALRYLARQQEQEHRRRVEECLERWYWGEVGDRPAPAWRIVS